MQTSRMKYRIHYLPNSTICTALELSFMGNGAAGYDLVISNRKGLFALRDTFSSGGISFLESSLCVVFIICDRF